MRQPQGGETVGAGRHHQLRRYGGAERLTLVYHAPRQHSEETHGTPRLILIDEGRKRGIDPGVLEEHFLEIARQRLGIGTLGEAKHARTDRYESGDVIGSEMPYPAFAAAARREHKGGT